MNEKKLGLLITCICMFLSASIVHAGASVSAVYSVVAVQSTTTGSLISLDVTVSNSGTVDLNSITIYEIDPTRQGGNSNTLNVGSLVVGAQAVSTWVITSSIPAGQIPLPLNLFFQGSGTNSNGNAVNVAVEGVAQ